MNTSLKTTHHGTLKSRGFIALLVTMACGAFNDNIYRGMLLMAVVAGGVWANELGEGGTGWITTMLYAPFVILLGIAGVVADRSPKRQIIIITRLCEIGLVAGVIIAMLLGNLWLACLMLIGLAAQSAFFSPAKYGIVPEIVGDSMLSRANGLLSLMSNTSIVAGMAIGGLLLDLGDHIGIFGGVLIGIVMAIIAVISLFMSLMLPRLPAGNSELPMSWNFVRTYWRTLRAMKGTGLLATAVAWCLFYAVASLLLLIIPNYREMFDLTAGETSYLMGIVGVGIAIGGFVAGFGSGHRIRASLAPLGAGGIGVCALLLGLIGTSYATVMLLLGFTGFFGGFFVVPILAMLQHAPEPGFRARCVGTANFLTFLAMTITAVVYGLLADTSIGAAPPVWFLITATVMLLVVIWLILLMPVLRRVAASDNFGRVMDRIG